MAVNARQYREHLYRLRAHPSQTAQAASPFVDSRDSFFVVYLSLIPFAAFEYIAETSTLVIPSGLVFPTSYLLFWAVYYSYYRPGFLEEKLTAPKKWDMLAVPTILMGVTIWFVKVTVVELGHFLLKDLFAPAATPQRRPQAARPPPPRPQPQPARALGAERAEGTTFYRAPSSRRPVEETTRIHRMATPINTSGLPRDISNALAILGLREGAVWDDIHRRYRQLAKQFHPDLNPEVTGAGKRFMMYDAAYRKLVAVRGKYFEKRAL